MYHALNVCLTCVLKNVCFTHVAYFFCVSVKCHLGIVFHRSIFKRSNPFFNIIAKCLQISES